MSKTVLVTGAAGFVGPQVVKKLIENTDYRIVVADKLTYAARVENGESLSLEMVLNSIQSDKNIDLSNRYSFVNLDICSPRMKDIIEAEKIDYLINLAAESHVDRSIDGSPKFIMTEIFGTHNLLETIRKQNSGNNHKIERAVFVSTDEVYGSIDRNANCENEEWLKLSDESVNKIIKKFQFTEETPLGGGSPYASCKGGSDLMVGSYFNTFKWDKKIGRIDERNMPLLTTRCTNNFGPFQHPEKLIPMVICTLLMPNVNGFRRKIPVYDNGLSVREWISTSDHASAILKVMHHGKLGNIYNIGSGKRCRVRDIIATIFEACREDAKANGILNFSDAIFDASKISGIVRPGHDLCYAADSSKILKDNRINWKCQDTKNLKKNICEVAEWYKKNKDWWVPLWSGVEFSGYWMKKYKKIQESNKNPFDFYPDYIMNKNIEL